MMHAPRAQRAILEYSKRDRTGNMGMGNIFFYRLKMGEYMPDVVPEIESKIFLKERKEKKRKSSPGRHSGIHKASAHILASLPTQYITPILLHAKHQSEPRRIQGKRSDVVSLRSVWVSPTSATQ